MENGEQCTQCRLPGRIFLFMRVTGVIAGLLCIFISVLAVIVAENIWGYIGPGLLGMFFLYGTVVLIRRLRAQLRARRTQGDDRGNKNEAG